MSPNLRWSTAMVALVTAGAACVHIPDSIKQEFRAAEPDERSNYQTGLHGTAPAANASDPWSRHAAAQAAADAGTPDAQPTDAAVPSLDPDAAVPGATVLSTPSETL